MRPYWKGYLKLALVSCPIALHAACSSAERIAFRQINKATGNRLRQQLIDEETREPVDPAHKGRGYQVAKGQYLIVEDEELEAIEIESTHVIEIDSFVPHQQIDQRFFDGFYYVAPDEPVAQEAFAVIREAMRHKAMVALGRLVLGKRERVIALEPYGKGLLGTTLRYPMRCATPRTISASCRSWRSRPTCSRSPRRSWRARSLTSTLFPPRPPEPKNETPPGALRGAALGGVRQPLLARGKNYRGRQMNVCRTP
jgi:Ku protein